MKLPDRLPTLTGRWLLAYRIFWCLLMALALFGATWGGWLIRAENVRDTKALYGVDLRWAGPSWSQIGPLGETARRAGVILGSDLLAIDGRPVSLLESGPRAVRALEGPDGRFVTLTVRSPDGVTHNVVLQRSQEHLRRADAKSPLGFEARSIFNWALGLAGSVMILIAAALMFRRRPADPVAALLSTGMLWSLATVSIALAFPDFDPRLNISSSVVASCFVLGLLHFPNGQFGGRWTGAGVVALVGYVVFVNTARDALQGVVDIVWSATLLVFCVGAIGRRYLQAGPGVERQQIKWVLLGAVLFLALNAAASLLDMALTAATDPIVRFIGIMAPRILTALAMVALVAGLLISILRHRLYDAETAISRSFSFGALTVVVVGVFAGAEKAIEAVGEQYLGGSIGSGAGALAAGLAAVVILPLHHRLSGWAERRFQGRLVGLKSDLPHDMDEMRDTETAAEVARHALEKTTHAVLAVRGAVLARNGDDWEIAAQLGTARPIWRPENDDEPFAVDRSDPDYPVRIALKPGGGPAAGWLLIGPRPDGSLYGKEEREALTSIAQPVGRALRVAQRREGEMASARARFEQLEAAVRDLKRRADGRIAATPAE